jgi:hypothetical protein
VQSRDIKEYIFFLNIVMKCIYFFVTRLQFFSEKHKILSPFQMSDTAADTAAVLPATTILPAKSEDKLEIEKEEQEEAAKSDQEAAAKADQEAAAENKDTEPAATENDETAAAAAGDEAAETAEKKEDEAGGVEGEDTEKKAEKKKFSLPKVKPPKVLTELRAKSKERKKVSQSYFFCCLCRFISRDILSEYLF